MPIHDWTKVEGGLFHDFHQDWIVEIRRQLNDGLLPYGYSALTDQNTGGPIPDVLALRRKTGGNRPERGLTVKDVAPQASYVLGDKSKKYADRANRILVHQHGEIVAVIEVMSPGNKDSTKATQTFIRKIIGLIHHGINVLIVDLFPPTVRDPLGIHRAIWDEMVGLDDTPVSPEKNRCAVAYHAGSEETMAYVEPLAVGDVLPSLPIFLNEFEYVPAPLESSYLVSWKAYPADFKELLENPS